MNFLTPAFLLGGLAIAIPIWIHLTHREKKDIVPFPSLMFLRKIPYRSVRRQRLRHLLLFSLRCLALLLLALAFARPFLEGQQAAASSALGPQELVLLLDNSYSMGYDGRFELAREEARGRIEAMDVEDRATIIVFSDTAEQLAQPSGDREALLAMVSTVELGSGTTSFGPALKLAKKLVDESRLSRKEVVLISDFQRGGWQGDEDVWLPAGTRLTPVHLGEPNPTNFSVTSVILERESLSGRERLRVSARVANKAPADAGVLENRIELELNERSLQTLELQLPPNSSEMVSFEPITLPAGVARGTVRLASDKLLRDNAYHFVHWPGQSLSVLALESPGRPARRSLYVRRALSLGDRPSFRLDYKRANQFQGGDLSGRHVVLLDDVSSLGASAAERLAEFVKAGGGLVIALGEKGGASSLRALGGAAPGLLPSLPGAPVDRSRDWGGTISFIDYSSPIFEIFNAPHSGDFSSAKFFRYRRFEQPVTDGVLARFDDGEVALAERRMGEGRVLVWTSTLDTFWNDLARQPVFLPFVHRLFQYAAGYSEASAWHQVGDVADLGRYLEEIKAASGSGGPDRELVVESPSSETTIIPPSEEKPLLSLSEQGFYHLRESGSSASSSLSLAVNLDLSESDLSTIDPEELVAAVTFRSGTEAESADAVWTPAEQERRQAFWFYLLAGAFLLLAIETVLSNRLSRTASI